MDDLKVAEAREAVRLAYEARQKASSAEHAAALALKAAEDELLAARKTLSAAYEALEAAEPGWAVAPQCSPSEHGQHGRWICFAVSPDGTHWFGTGWTEEEALASITANRRYGYGGPPKPPITAWDIVMADSNRRRAAAATRAHMGWDR